MTRPCDLLTAYVDGELDAGEAEVFALHLDGCTTCPAELHDALQVVALEAAVRVAPAPAATGPAGARAARRWRLGTWSRLSLAVAAAAVIVLVVMRLRDGGERASPPIVLATATDRSIEGRLSYAAAAAHRPYRVGRSGSAPATPADSIALETFALLERRGDLHGVAAAYVLTGDPVRALATLDRASPGLDVAADRGLALLASGRAADALVALDAVLERAPGHPQALWNRALALRDLGLSLLAVEAFDAVAALAEPGWSDEARLRSRELAKSVTEQRSVFERLVTIDGPRLATAPDAVTPEIARRIPGAARLFFYDAVRSAPTAEVVRQLAPLARTLDAVSGGDHLARYVERVARADFSRRGPLAARYLPLVTGHRLDAAAGRRFLDELRAAGQDDMLLGAMIRASVDGRTVPEDLLPEMRRLAEATRDPWFELLATEKQATALLARRDHAAVEVAVQRVLGICERGGFDFRCAWLELVLGQSYLEMNRLADAKRMLEAGQARARRAGEWFLDQKFYTQLENVEALGDEVAAKTLAIVRAYAGEHARRRDPAACEVPAGGHELIAMMLANQQNIDGARAELALATEAARGCARAQLDIQGALTRAHVLRNDPRASAAEVADLRAQMATLRASGVPAVQAFVDQAEGRLLIDRDRVAGIALLEHAIAAARTLPPDDVLARRARAYAYAVLVLDAGRAGEWDRVWRLLGEETGVQASERCALGVALEDRRSVVVVRDATGALHGAYDGARRDAALEAARLIPAPLRDRLAACPAVEVIARAPIHGQAGLLGNDVAWSYRSGPGSATSEPPHGARLVISNTEPPAQLGLPRLRSWRASTPGDRVLDGAAATPSRALAELADAGYVEIHVHGIVNAALSDASFLAMSRESDGRYALTAAAIRGQRLRGRPVVVLAACHAAETAPYHHQPWSLPAAFIDAGARAVIASPGVLDDADAGDFFDALRVRLERGDSPAIALRDARTQWLAAHPGATWVHSLMVFQ